MFFQYACEIWDDYPALVSGALSASGITDDVNVDRRIAEFQAVARSRLTETPEGDWPEIQAWRRVFSAMGFKPTQYRCAAESLLRRFRKDGALPRLHPLVDLCNAISLAFAVPIAVFDVLRIEQSIQVRYAAGDEQYLSFAGEFERPEAGEVIFADAAARAHARRWTHRQSASSAVRSDTEGVLIVAEAHHAAAMTEIMTVLDVLSRELSELWTEPKAKAILTKGAPAFEFQTYR
jgi:DNA/RNA-binding domain of Phe-tRNA-synthetase-like protein